MDVLGLEIDGASGKRTCFEGVICVAIVCEGVVECFRQRQAVCMKCSVSKKLDGCERGTCWRRTKAQVKLKKSRLAILRVPLHHALHVSASEDLARCQPHSVIFGNPLLERQNALSVSWRAPGVHTHSFSRLKCGLNLTVCWTERTRRMYRRGLGLHYWSEILIFDQIRLKSRLDWSLARRWSCKQWLPFETSSSMSGQIP